MVERVHIHIGPELACEITDWEPCGWDIRLFIGVNCAAAAKNQIDQVLYLMIQYVFVELVS